MPDFIIEAHGSLASLTPRSDRAHDWIAAHIADDAMRMGASILIEPRYLPPIIEAIGAAGLVRA